MCHSLLDQSVVNHAIDEWRRRLLACVNGSGPLSQRSAIANVQGGLDWIQTIFFF